jgi:hypothetical protein
MPRLPEREGNEPLHQLFEVTFAAHFDAALYDSGQRLLRRHIAIHDHPPVWT